VKLRPVTFYEFQTGQLRGYLKGSGASPGIEIIASGEGRPLTSPGGSLMTLTHYLSSSLAGPEAALNAPGRTEELSGDTLFTRFPPAPQWPVDALVDFSVAEGGRIDVGFHFHFRKAMDGFEAQVVSTFSEQVPAAHLHVGGEWFRPSLRAKDLCFFSRDEAAAAMIASGRWDFYLAQGFNLILDERGYDYPLLVYLHEKSGWALAQMLVTDESPSISLSSSPVQYNFSLVGRSVKEGEEVSCHARILYGQFRGLEGILPLYHQFIREVRAGGFAAPQPERRRTRAKR